MGGDPRQPKGPHGRGPSGAQGTPWEGTLGSPKDPMGGEPLGAQGTPWDGTLGSPRDPMGGDPWEPKGSHGRGPWGAQGTPWEGTLGSPKGSHGMRCSGVSHSFMILCKILIYVFWEHPGTTEDQFGGSWGPQGHFWMHSVMK